MKQYRVITEGSFFGIYCGVGDIITVLSPNKWTVTSRPSCEFVGKMESQYLLRLSRIDGEDSNKSAIELKINQMWHRQPYMQKKLGVRKEESPYERFNWYSVELSSVLYDEASGEEMEEIPDEPGFNFLTR